MNNLLDLEELVGGALQEKVNMAMQEVLNNMQDSNTPWKNKRHIIIKISFTQNEDRDDAAVEVSVDTKTAPISPMATRMMIGKDLKNGAVYAREYGKQIRGQMRLDLGSPQIQEVDGEAVDTKTGEIISGDSRKVIDLRKAAL